MDAICGSKEALRNLVHGDFKGSFVAGQWQDIAVSVEKWRSKTVHKTSKMNHLRTPSGMLVLFSNHSKVVAMAVAAA